MSYNNIVFIYIPFFNISFRFHFNLIYFTCIDSHHELYLDVLAAIVMG